MTESVVTTRGRKFSDLLEQNYGAEGRSVPEEALIAFGLVLDPDDVAYLDFEAQRAGFDRYQGRLVAISNAGSYFSLKFKPASDQPQYSEVTDMRIQRLRGEVKNVEVRYGLSTSGVVERDSITVGMSGGAGIELPLRRQDDGVAFIDSVLRAVELVG